MQVKLDMDDVMITLGNNGVTLAISQNDGKHVGHLRIGQATVRVAEGAHPAGKWHEDAACQTN